MMKKTLTRALSLLLVLVMVLGAMPFAMADDLFENETDRDDTGVEPDVTPVVATVSLGANRNVLVNEEVTLNVTVSGVDLSKFTPSYSWENASSSTGTAKVSFAAPGEYTVKCTVSFTGTGAPAPATGSVTINVTEPAAVTAITLSPSTASLTVGETKTLTATATPAGASLAGMTWHSSDDTVATVSTSGKVTAVKDGTAEITAKVGDVVSNKCIVTVTGITPTLTVEDVFCKVGDTGRATITYKNLGNASPTHTAAVVSGDKTVISNLEVAPYQNYVDFKAVKEGTCTVKVTSSLTDSQGVDLSDTFTITVSNGTISCDNYSKEVSYNGSYTLNPVCYGSDNKIKSDVDWSFKELSKRGNITVNTTTGKVVLGGNDPAVIKVGITAYDKGTQNVVATGTAYVSFYVDNDDIEVTMPSNARTLSFGDYADTKERDRLDGLMLDGYQLVSGVYSAADSVQIDSLSANEGRLSTGTASPFSVNSIANVVFTAGAAGKATFNYTVYSSSMGNMPLVQGDVTIVYDSADGDIEYSTSYNKAVTFKESDFTNFWDDIADDEDFDGDLDYVMFPVLPETGKMYTSTSSTSNTYAYSTKHQFYCGTVPSGTNNKDLGSLTYVPSTSKLTSYDVTIPFVAYGEKTRETASGYVVIHVNETSDSITSRGIFFGTKYDSSNTYADMIADKFEDKTDEDLEYVIFELPDVEKATLYSTIPTDYAGNSMVAQGTALRYNEKLYYGSSSSATLKKAALIPAAGFSGTITLEYTAYSKNGSEEYEGTITFTVAKKTKSGVFNDVGTTYNWAADSVDFLYYEGIAQGSNNKYNPAANITRGDFMLMLYRAFLEDDYSTYNVTTNFADVAKGTTEYSQETYQAVGVAKYLGIAQGTNNKYNPKAYITREEAMTLIYRTLSKINRDLTYTSGVSASSFSDYSKISSYATTAISNLVGHGVIVGSNNKITPKTNITRAEMACILHRVITY